MSQNSSKSPFVQQLEIDLANNETKKNELMNNFIKFDSLTLNEYTEFNTLTLNEYIKLKKFKINEDEICETLENAIVTKCNKYYTDIFKIIDLEKWEKLRKNLDPFNEEMVYGKIIDYNEENIILKMTLYTQYMLRFDQTFYGSSGVFEQAISLKHTEENSNITIIKSINSNLNKLSDSENIQYIKIFQETDKYYNEDFINILLNVIKQVCRPYFFELETELPKNIGKHLEELELYEFYKYEIRDPKKDNDPEIDNNWFFSYVIFAASPFEMKGKELKLKSNTPQNEINESNEETFQTVENIITLNDFDKLNKVLEGALPNSINKLTYKINHVGQGLNTYLLINNNRTILFDVGHSFFSIKNDRTIKLGDHTYSNLAPKLVVLSHWDTDHILGIAKCNDKIFDAPWFVPDLNYNIKIFSNSAIRLNYYLYQEELRKNLGKSNYKNYLYNIDNEFNGNIIATYSASFSSKDACKISLYKGKGKNNSYTNIFKYTDSTSTKEVKLTKNSNEKNNLGIYLEIEYCDKSLLSPGDCDYISLHSSINNNSKEYDYLIASHHGSYADIPEFKLKNKDSKIIVPVGKNYDKHPVYVNNLDEMKKKYNQYTNVKKNIEIIETQYHGDFQIKL